jgi:hypothetical protein
VLGFLTRCRLHVTDNRNGLRAQPVGPSQDAQHASANLYRIVENRQTLKGYESHQPVMRVAAPKSRIMRVRRRISFLSCGACPLVVLGPVAIDDYFRKKQ